MRIERERRSAVAFAAAFLLLCFLVLFRGWRLYEEVHDVMSAASREAAGRSSSSGRAASEEAGGGPPSALSPVEVKDMVRKLVRARPFGHTEVKAAAKPVRKPASPPRRAPAVPRPSTLELVGTMTGSGWGVAFIRDRSSRTEGMYAVGDSVSGGWVVEEISRRKVRLRASGGRETELTLGGGAAGAGAAVAGGVRGGAQSSPVASSSYRAASGGIERRGNVVYVPRSEARKHLSSLSELFSAVRVQPYIENGKPRGFRLSGIRKGSFLERLGAREGDVVSEVNGEVLDSVRKAFSLFSRYHGDSSVEITILRDGRRVPLSFVLK